VPNFASTDAPRESIPIKNHRYQIPRWPFTEKNEAGQEVPVRHNFTEPVKGVGMLQNWTRASTVVDTHKDKENLIKWRSRLVAKGMGDREDLVALAAAARLSDRTTLNNVATQAFDHAKGQAASNLGSALHGFLERTLNGERDLVIPERWRGDVAGVLATFQDLGIKLNPDHQELVIVRPDLKDGDAAGLAGRFDLLGEYEGKLTVIDYKTGSDPLEYGAWEIQQKGGLYATGWAIWDGEFWHPMPVVRQDLTLMVHVLPGQGKDGVSVHEVDLDLAELEEDLAAAYRTRRRRKEAKKAHRLVVLDADPLDGQDSPTEHPDTVERAATPDQQAQVDKAAERMAKLNEMAIAAGRNDEDDDELGFGNDEIGSAQAAGRNDEDDDPDAGYVTPAGVAALQVGGDGKPLAPLAGPGERGCGVCHRKGHKRGSPKCLGLDDPAVTNKNVQDYADGKNDRFSAPEPAHTHGVDGWTRNPLTGHWECGTEGCDVSAAEPVAEQLTAEQAEPTMTTADGPGQTVPVPDADNEPDPFDDNRDEAAAADADWHLFLDRINEAKDKAEIRQIRSEATELGVWNDQLLQAGLARIKAL
jgi:hypothetical protein